MRVLICRTSGKKNFPEICGDPVKNDDGDYYGPAELSSLEDLLALQKEFGHLVLTPAFIDGYDMGIEIYDDYRE